MRNMKVDAEVHYRYLFFSQEFFMYSSLLFDVEQKRSKREDDIAGQYEIKRQLVSIEVWNKKKVINWWLEGTSIRHNECPTQCTIVL